MTIAIYIPAYNAERFIGQVMRRIPADFLARTAEVIVVDNASTDRTSGVARETARELGLPHFTLIRNPNNVGYGGSQKVAYSHCIKQGHDIVVMLHADGQYAPELLDNIVGPLVRGEADPSAAGSEPSQAEQQQLATAKLAVQSAQNSLQQTLSGSSADDLAALDAAALEGVRSLANRFWQHG